jgi:nucleoside-diphosphate-sugar epimerase
MTDPAQALAAAARPAPRQPARQRRVLVLGGGGALGSLVVERLLAGRRFAHVGVWTVQPLQPALRGLEPVPQGDWPSFQPDTAVIVFDRERHANGRDLAFGRPLPAELLPHAVQLHALGVSTLVVVVPHAPGALPQALKAGLASLDEGAVAALGLRHLVFMRAAQAEGAAPERPAPERLAHWLLGQLQWMLPQRDQPVRGATVARVAAHLALALPEADPGSRVVPPDLLWAAAQTPKSDAVVDAWLLGTNPDVLPAKQHW